MNSSEADSKSDVDLSPVRASVEVGLPLDGAFELFTSSMGSWWPLADHSIGQGRVTGIGFEPSEGGRVFEIWDNGEEKDWARVLVWDPPHRVILAWHPSLDPGTPTEVDVRFTPVGSSTRVDLIHSGWDRVEKHRRELRSSYLPGWGVVLGAYQAGAGAA